MMFLALGKRLLNRDEAELCITIPGTTDHILGDFYEAILERPFYTII